MYRHRFLSSRLIRLTEHFPVTVVSGARQVGKTTLLRHLFPGHDYVVLDASLDLEGARRDPDLFLLNHPPPLIVDEIQYAPELVAAIKRRVGRNTGMAGQFILTGSQQWQVLKTLSESLAGRAAFLDLYGFSLAELAAVESSWLSAWLDAPEQFPEWSRTAPRYSGDLTAWLWKGGMPGAQTLPDDLVADFWSGYHRTYIERDARLMGEVQDWQEFGRFLGMMTALTAQEINYSQLGREIGITPQTARRWLRILEATFQWFELPAYSGNAVKRVSLRPKGHLLDPGLACHHARISSPRMLAAHPLYGALFESAMVQELRKQTASLGITSAWYHWRSAGGAEVDLILERDATLYPFEFKLTTRPTPRDASGIRAFAAAYPGRRVAPGAILCAVEKPGWIAADIMAIPWNLV
ncbi:MAG TPA: ATP-binding protein [Anaerolineaceae bacterium]